MKDSEVLRRARDSIESGVDVFICLAIAKNPLYNGLYDSEIPLVCWINSMLNEGRKDNPTTYSGWLPIKLSMEMDAEDFKQGRLQWLDWMIDYCEKEENNE